MKRLLFLLIGPLFFFSCSDEEKPVGNFIDGTKWECNRSRPVHNDNGVLLYSCQDKFVLSFTNATFTYTADSRYDRIVDGVSGESYAANGTYTFEYPVTTLLSDDGRVPKKITIGTYQIEAVSDSGGKLEFVKVRE
jgi:hypothetical protein